MMRYWMIFCIVFNAMIVCSSAAEIETENEIEVLSLDVIQYELFIKGDPEALGVLERALHENGIVGIRGIPGYREKVLKFIEMAREFSALPEEVKEACAPNRSLGGMFFGYEKGE